MINSYNKTSLRYRAIYSLLGGTLYTIDSQLRFDPDCYSNDVKASKWRMKEGFPSKTKTSRDTIKEYVNIP